MKNLLSILSLLIAIAMVNSCGSGQNQSGDRSTATTEVENPESETEEQGANKEEDHSESETEKQGALTEKGLENVPAEGENYTIATTETGIPSPRKEMKGTIGDAEITIDYGSPSLRDRSIGKELASYGKLWRTGANEATSIAVSKDIKVGGKDLKAGKYGLFTIPGETNWTVIINEVHDMWGAGNYDEAKDIIRLEIPAKMVEDKAEMMDFLVEGSNIVLRWGNHAIEIPVSA